MESLEGTEERKVEKGFKAGFVAIVGRPNVGKSTLLNYILGYKLAIVTPKPQTTRTNIFGVKNLPNAQIIFVDTPGFHKPVNALGKRMLEHSKEASGEADVILMLVDASEPLKKDDYDLLDYISSFKAPKILALNKVDKVKDKREILPRIEELMSSYDFVEAVPISAYKGENVDRLLEVIVKYLPEAEGPLFEDEDTPTVSKHFFVSEIIREKIMRLTHQEVPYKTAVEVESIEDKGNVIVIRATIYVEKEGQKGIIIGKGGSMIKKIGTYAREELELVFGKKVHLDLWVKVKEKWTSQEDFLRAIGY